MTNDLSILPSLKDEKTSIDPSLSESTKKRPLSSLMFSFTSQISPSHLIREANNLTNRLDKAEKNLKELCLEVPKNTQQMLKNFESSLKTIKTNSNLLINGTENSNVQVPPDATEQLEMLESELRNDIQTKFFEFNSLAKDKIDRISINIQKANAKQENQIDRYDRNIDNFLNETNKKKQEKIEDLEIKLNKLKKYSQPIENILSYSEPINSNSIQIKELQRKLSSIILEVDNKIKPKNNDTNSLFITSGAVYTKKSDKTPVNQQNNDNNFNLQNSFQNIHDDINLFKQSFNDALLLSYNKAQDCEMKMMEIEHISEGIKNSIQILENKLASEEILIQEIFDQIEKLDQKSKNKSNLISLQILAEQIKSTSNNMKNTILSMKQKVKKCEISLPLVQFD